MANEERIRQEIEALRRQIEQCKSGQLPSPGLVASLLQAQIDALTWVLECPGRGA